MRMWLSKNIMNSSHCSYQWQSEDTFFFSFSPQILLLLQGYAQGDMIHQLGQY